MKKFTLFLFDRNATGIYVSHELPPICRTKVKKQRHNPAPLFYLEHLLSEPIPELEGTRVGP